MVVWFYYTNAMNSTRLWNGSMSVRTGNPDLKIHTVPVPTERAKAAYAQVNNPDDLMLTKSGTKVKLVVESDQEIDEAVVKKALQSSVEKAGWVVSPDAELSVVAIIGRGAPYKLEFEKRVLFFIPVPGDKTKKVKITPFTAKLEIRKDALVLWTRKTQNIIPPYIDLKEGETIKEAVKQFERPEPEFFERVHIPPRIPQPAYTKGIGASRIEKGVWINFDAYSK